MATANKLALPADRPETPSLIETVEEPQAIKYGDAFKSIINRDFCFGEKYREQQTRANRLGAHPEILEFERLLIKRLYKFGVPMFAHCVWRGEAEQNRLYVKGFSKVKYPESAHNAGCAVDIIHGIHGWNIGDKAWQMVGHIGHELAASKGWKLRWGGPDGPNDQFGWDPAHWELTNWRVRKSELA